MQVGLGLLAAAAATLVPAFAVLSGLVGGVSQTFLAFVLPPLMLLRLSNKGAKATTTRAENRFAEMIGVRSEGADDDNISTSNSIFLLVISVFGVSAGIFVAVTSLRTLSSKDSAS